MVLDLGNFELKCAQNKALSDCQCNVKFSVFHKGIQGNLEGESSRSLLIACSAVNIALAVCNGYLPDP